MARLPYSRVVNVTLTRNDAFPTRRGFGVAMLLTNETKAGEVDADNRTKMYANMEEVAADWPATSEVYKGAELAFSQNPRPLHIKVGYVDVATPATETAADLKDELDLVFDYDGDWYWLGIIKPFRDTNMLDGLVEWIEAKA